MMASDPLLVDATVSANAAYNSLSDDAFKAKVLKMEKEWNSPAAEVYIKPMLDSRASRMLKRWTDLDRRFLRLTLTDSHGAVIAATHKTLDYFQGDEDFWQNTNAQGRGAVHITDVLYDDVTKNYYIGLGMPIMAEGTNVFLGALDALVEVSSVFPALNRVDGTEGMRAALVKGDGTIIFSPGTDLSMNRKSEEFIAVADTRGKGGAGQGYLFATMRSGATTLVGYADTGLRRSFPNLGWHVLVTQDTREAFAATRGVLRLILFSIAVAIAAITLLGVYILMHKRVEILDLKAGERMRAGAANA
jgi:hypothetical protein